MLDLISRLRENVGADPQASADELQAVLDEARALIKQHCGTGLETVPTVIQDRATLEVASELWAKRNAIGGIMAGYSDAGPVRLARDPMIAAYPLLRPYLHLVIA